MKEFVVVQRRTVQERTTVCAESLEEAKDLVRYQLRDKFDWEDEHSAVYEIIDGWETE